MLSIEQKIKETLKRAPFTIIEQNAVFWKRRFGILSYITPSLVAIPAVPIVVRENRLVRFSKGIESLINQRRYKDVQSDIIENCVKHQNLRLLFKYFESIEQLFGIKLLSKISGTKLVYEGLVTLDMKLFEQITTNDDDILDEVENSKIARVIRKTILPLNSQFTNSFFKELRDTIQ